MPRAAEFRGTTVSTGIFKSPVKGPVHLGFTNLEGDGQADLRVHGGLEKALYAYDHGTYSEWEKIRPGETFEYGAFGENLCVDTLPESSIYVGDTYQVGSAKVQACQPRFPCQKLAIKFQDLAILKQFNTLGRPGVYYRVIEEGTLAAGDSFKLLSQEKIRVSIQELFEMSSPDNDEERARVREILSVRSIPDTWRKKLHGWVNP
jgi:MOSC domain-containing protein YiiM